MKITVKHFDTMVIIDEKGEEPKTTVYYHIKEIKETLEAIFTNIKSLKQ